MFALITGTTVAQIEETPFEVHPGFQWVEFDPGEQGVKANGEWLYEGGAFIHNPALSPPSVLVDPTPGALDVVQLLLNKGLLEKADLPEDWVKEMGL